MRVFQLVARIVLGEAAMPTLNPEIFREYDIRGVADRDLDRRVCHLLGRAFGTFLRRAGKRRIALGRDCRLHSRRIRATRCSAGSSTAASTSSTSACAPRRCSTSRCIHWDIDGGVKITGSHNPAAGERLQDLRRQETISGAEIHAARRDRRGGATSSRRARRECDPTGPCCRLRRLRERADPRSAKLRVAIDAGNGAGRLPSRADLRAPRVTK